MKEEAEISVIIPALNEEKYIKNVFAGLREQTFKDFETIVVDGNSTDRTRDIARKYARVVIEKKRGIGRARNRGATEAKGKLLVFLDGDTKPAKTLLETYRKAFKNRHVVAATGPIFPLEKTSKRISLGFEVVSVLFVKSSIFFGRPSVVGLNFAVRKKAFQEIGGFDEKLATYEDWDLSLRLRKKGAIVYLDDAIVYTSARRIKAWGISGFFFYHVGNIFKYHLLRHPNEYYEPIR